MKALYKRMSVVLLVCMMLQLLVPFQSLLGNVSADNTMEENMVLDGGFEKVVSEMEENMVPNGGFEKVVSAKEPEWSGLQPEGWGAWLASKNGKVSVTSDVYHSGAYSVQIEHLGSDRTGLSINVPVLTGGDYKLGAWIKTSDVVSNGGVFVRTQFYKRIKGLDGSDRDEKLADGPATNKMSGTNDWTLQEVVLSVPADAKYVRLEPFFETGQGTVWFDDLTLQSREGVTGLALEPKLVSLEKGGSTVLTPIFTPQDVVDRSVIWTSSDPKVASVYEGTVTAEDYGTATITVSTPDGLITAKSFVTVESGGMLDGYNALRQKWYDKLVGGAWMDMNDSDVSAYIEKLSIRISNPEGTGTWDRMNKTPDAQYLWQDVIDKGNTDSAAISTAYSMIKDMAIAYSTEGTAQFRDSKLKDDIVGALDWMYAYQYNENKKIVGNWWDWEIGTPQALMDILVLLYDDLTKEKLEKFLNVIDKFVPDPTKRVQNASVTETGANLLDKALVVVLRGVVGKQSFKIEQGQNSIFREFQYAKSGDGIYEDGSLIQHSNIAYTGSYGGVLVGRMADLLYLFNTSPWEIQDPSVENVYDWIEDSFEALIYKGAMMDMVKGRSISREKDSDHLTGRAIIRTMARLAEGAPTEQSIKIKSMIKEWVQSDITFSNYYENMPVYEMNLIKAIMKDFTIMSRGELVKHQNFAAMDRVVHLRPGYGFALSMFSDRISAFEFGNGENKKGWYTGIGMTSLYNNDLSQYSNQYWPTVDMYRLAGTTTDGYAQGPKDWASYYNPKAWVGGSSMEDQFGAVGMNFSLKGSTGSELQGKKSWFMFDDEIVALGSDIASSANRKVETIVENRQLNANGTNKLTVDGKAKSDVLGWEESLKGMSWAHLEGNTAGSDIGYYFPERADIAGKREARTGSWKDINNGGSSEQMTRNYLSLAFDHGNAPQNSSYAYVLLPNKDATGTEQYSLNPDIEILSKSNKVHAVRENKLGMTAFNFWEASQAEFVRAFNPASVMVKEDGDKLTVSVSDPTQKQDKIVVDLGKVVLKEMKKDASINVLQTSPYLKLEIDTKGSIGKSHVIQFQYDPTQTPGLDGDPVDQGEKVIVYVAEDAYVNAGSKANQNFGSVGYLNIKNGANDYLRKTFLKYDLSGISGVGEIESVKLNVYARINDSRGKTAKVGAYEVGSNAWSEGALTWNNMPAIGAAIETITLDSENQWRQYDVTSFAKSRIELDKQLSVALQGETDLTADVRSKENEGGIYKSYLEITLKPVIPVTGIQLNSEQAVLVVGENVDLAATIMPYNATNMQLKWKVDYSDVLKLESDGLKATVTALKPGRAKVTVTTEDDKFSATCEIRVVLTSTIGDLNGDGKVTVGDLGIASAHFGKISASSDWGAIEAADINGDGIIDAIDLKWFAEKILTEQQ
ncbi:DNRLRE domain-containing protein [Paenibacillus anaericanus]|uniref:DNRLRE domain-containing protein n=1 Tax=Paenibacillus anaericanus TaxID=170367 RepID=A0A433Y5B9_9BACL|nr:polysaccharide lyase family 8 super-sandwich domain-containing protein [Paenibacillus anaericanus]RUT43733.1 DNRLRE domain-containing protein [Paenibacillus anaericanus]